MPASSAGDVEGQLATLQRLVGFEAFVLLVLVVVMGWIGFMRWRDRSYTRAQKAMMLAAAKTLGITTDSNAYQESLVELGYAPKAASAPVRGPEVLVSATQRPNGHAKARVHTAHDANEVVVYGSPPATHPTIHPEP